MKVLVGCECSGVVREAFRARGHDAWSCDIQAADDGSQFHYQIDLLEVIGMGWDLGIFHPPCTYLSTVGAIWFKKDPTRASKREDALKFFLACYNAPIKMVCCENPSGFLNTMFRKPDQTIHPYFFGDAEKKRTCLWLRGLPKLQHFSEEELFNKRSYADEPKPKWIRPNGEKVHWCESLVTLPKSERAKVRSRTFQGIANAMAEQWG